MPNGLIDATNAEWERHRAPSLKALREHPVLPSAPLAGMALDEAVAYLANASALEGVVAFGTTGLPTQSTWADHDLFLVIADWPASVRVAVTNIGGRLTDLLFAQPAAVERLRLTHGALDSTSWDGRLARALGTGRLLFDRAGRLAEAQRHLQEMPEPRIVASAADAYRFWFRINYNRLQTRRMFDAADPDYLLAADARLLYMVSEVFTGYFAARGLIWDGEKAAIRHLRAHDPGFLDGFRACIGTTDTRKRFRLYEELARDALEPIGPLWEQIPTAFDSDTGIDDSLGNARLIWQVLIGGRT